MITRKDVLKELTLAEAESLRHNDCQFFEKCIDDFMSKRERSIKKRVEKRKSWTKSVYEFNKKNKLPVSFHCGKCRHMVQIAQF